MTDEASPKEINITVLAEEAYENFLNKDSYVSSDPKTGEETIMPYFSWNASRDIIEKTLLETGMHPADLLKMLIYQGGFEDQLQEFSDIASGEAPVYKTFTELFTGLSADTIALKMLEMDPYLDALDMQKIPPPTKDSDHIL